MYDKDGMLVYRAVRVAETWIGNTQYIEIGSICYMAADIKNLGDRIVCNASGSEIIL
jgi:hypothetical protein